MLCFGSRYNPDEEIAFSSGMMGSQAGQGGNRDGPQLPGLENLGADAVVAGESLSCAIFCALCPFR